MFKVIVCVILMLGALTAQAQEVIKLGTTNTVVMRGEIDDKMAQNTALELLRLSTLRGLNNYPIYLVIDSGGGSIDAGEAFIEVVKTIPNVHTVTIFAASMASAIVEALPGERLMLDSGVFMFHRARGGVQGQFETGELEARLEFYKRFVRRMEARNAKRMGMSLKYYKSQVKDELWMTSGDSVGIAADKVVSLQCSQSLIEKREQMSVSVFIFKIELEFSGCPLLRSPDVVPGQESQAIEAYRRLRAEQDLRINLGVAK
jgi:ATP-dependent protease ClpP protease subunit